MKPVVSIVMSLYNKPFSVERAIRSVLAQTVKDFELVIVDDGSTDDSAKVVASIEDTRVRCVHQANGGPSSARNRGIAETQSDLIAFVDADDVWFPHFLHTVLALYDRFPQAGAFSTAFFSCRDGKIIRFPHAGVRFQLEGEILEDYFKSCVLGSNMVCTSSVMIKREVLNEVGGFPVGVENGQDLYLWARIALRYPIAWSPIECAVWHLSAENRRAGMIVMEDIPFGGILEEAMRAKEHSIEQKKWIREYMVRYRLNYSEVSMVYGNRKGARKLLKLARHTQVSRKRWWMHALRLYLPETILRVIRRARKHNGAVRPLAIF